MRIHEIVIIPGAGHLGSGTYERGHATGNLAEVDLVDKYVAAMADELDNSAIRHRIVPTRKAPGLTPTQIAATIFPNTLVVHCRVGWSNAKKIAPVHNISSVYFNETSGNFTGGLSDVIGHWGSLYVFGHKVSKPCQSREMLTNIPDTMGVLLEPFMVNGPNAQDYARWLHKLGHDVGRFLAEYCRNRDDNAALKTQGFMAPRARQG